MRCVVVPELLDGTMGLDVVSPCPVGCSWLLVDPGKNRSMVPCRVNQYLVNLCVRYCYASLVDPLDLEGSSFPFRLNWYCEHGESDCWMSQVDRRMERGVAQMVGCWDLVSVCAVNASSV